MKKTSSGHIPVPDGPREAAPSPKRTAVRPKQIQGAAERGVKRRGAEPTEVEMIERIDRSPGFFASLTDEQWDAIESYDGPEVLGGSDAPHEE